jgi:hypothetical protein
MWLRTRTFSGVLITGALVGACLLHVQAAHETVSPDDFKKVMVALGAALDILDETISSPAYLLNSARGDGLMRVAEMSSRLPTVRSFFVAHKRDDAVYLIEQTTDAIEALRTELARAEPRQAAAIDALDDLRTACAACHALYREGTKETGFRFKRGVL